MPLDLTGIQNVGEFYSHHYLDALLDKDLKGLFARWQAEEAATPDKRLEGCAADHFKAKSRALNLHRPELRYSASHNISVEILQALGYEYDLAVHYLADGSAVPTLSTIERGGHPYLWLLETTFTDPDTTPLDNHLLKAQFPPTDEPIHPSAFSLHTYEDVVGQIFRLEQPPRWLILLAGRFVYLIDRAKWGQGQYLLFDLDEIFGRRQRDTLRATAALLSRDALAPADGLPIHDTLDENSHKHAYGVSTDLKYGVRKAVELLANEYVWYQQNIGRKALYSDEKLAQELTHECLTYLYRLLFLFYAEARSSELGLVPMQADAYRAGYSLEALRDLEQVPLNTPQAQNGYFINESLNQLFKLVNEGYPDVMRQMGLDEAAQPAYDDYGFTITGLQSPLFDREATPRLAGAKLRNSVLQEVVQLLSLSRERKGRGKKNQRGRISYAQLGINQLGAVYEGLLSYTGFFAQETLFEVKPAGSKDADETGQTYFIPESDLERYKEDEFVYETGDDGARRRKRYPKGRFIFRLAGRDREKSASYYTPEVLTECVVKYSLKELLGQTPEDENWKSADEILQLTICEPAMGSGAFINEAINQLADAYLQRKQAETGEPIPVDQYHLERQKVKAHLALHNSYGVDLNPMAAELAEVSIWLNTIYPGMPAPWFEARLAVGNSLIGARRQIYSAKDVLDGSYASKAPEPVSLSQPRPAGSVYHWLLPDKGMAAFDKDKVIKQLAPDAAQTIKDWHKEFTKKISKAELKQMQALSDAADNLWQRHVRDRIALLETTRTPIAIWGQANLQAPTSSLQSTQLTVDEKRTELARINRPTSPYRRLKLAMDYWCALWFWPISEVGSLPERADFLADMAALLIGPQHEFDRPPEQLSLITSLAPPRQSHLAETTMVDVDALIKSNKRLTMATQTQQRTRFHHWDLAFAELFERRGGFDLIVGNPPWVRITFNEGGLLSDFAPEISIRKLSSSQISKLRPKLTKITQIKTSYLEEFSEMAGSRNYLGASCNYYLIAGKPNLYKSFITRSWDIGGVISVIGLIHPEGVYDDPKGGLLRGQVYKRLRKHFQFSNELKLFVEIGNQAKYSINIYKGVPSKHIAFDHIVNLFHPVTIDECYQHNGVGTIPRVRNNQDNWETRGHKKRIIKVDEFKLDFFARLFEESESIDTETRLLLIHSMVILSVLEKLSLQKMHLKNHEQEFMSSFMFDETASQKRGLIERNTTLPKSPVQLIISGPHFYVATPFNKTPNENCRSHRDYSATDLTSIPNDYLPRTNFTPSVNSDVFYTKIPTFNGKPITSYYRHVNRRMVATALERTFIPAIIPPQLAHIQTVMSLAFSNNSLLVDFEVMSSSILIDFMVRSTGTSQVDVKLISMIPMPDSYLVKTHGRSRILRLNCLTLLYDSLWQELYNPVFNQESWSKNDPRLRSWANLGPDWEYETALRTPFERRQALVEIDVIVALALKLTLDELLAIYQVDFPVLQKYERRMLFDQRGMDVPVKTIRGQLGVDESHPDFPSMVPPFTPVDREADYRQAWAHFEQRLKEEN